MSCCIRKKPLVQPSTIRIFLEPCVNLYVLWLACLDAWLLQCSHALGNRPLLYSATGSHIAASTWLRCACGILLWRLSISFSLVIKKVSCHQLMEVTSPKLRLLSQRQPISSDCYSCGHKGLDHYLSLQNNYKGQFQHKNFHGVAEVTLTTIMPISFSAKTDLLTI